MENNETITSVISEINSIKVENISILNKKSIWYVFFVVLFIVILASIYPVIKTTNGNYEPGLGVLLLGWIGVFFGSIAWYWFIPFFILISGMFNGSIFNWGVGRKIINLLFFIVCFFNVLFIFSVGKISPFTAGPEPHIAKVSGSVYLYYSLIFYLFLVILSFCFSGLRSKLNIILNILSTIFLFISLIISVIFLPAFNS